MHTRARSDGSWRVETVVASPGELHALTVEDPPVPTVRICVPTRPGLVLGSSQDTGLVDLDAASAAGFEVVRRRSGGGVVVVTPGDDVWLDVVVPAGHRLADPDVGRAFWWLGEVCAGVVAAAGAVPRVHRGRWVAGPGDRLVCFAGLGPGEVTVDGRKVVGIAQRRTREWSRFSVTVLTRWDPRPLAEMLVPLRHAAGTVADLADVAVGLEVEPDRLAESLVEALTDH